MSNEWEAVLCRKDQPQVSFFGDLRPYSYGDRNMWRVRLFFIVLASLLIYHLILLVFKLNPLKSKFPERTYWDWKDEVRSYILHLTADPLNTIYESQYHSLYPKLFAARENYKTERGWVETCKELSREYGSGAVIRVCKDHEWRWYQQPNNQPDVNA